MPLGDVDASGVPLPDTTVVIRDDDDRTRRGSARGGSIIRLTSQLCFDGGLEQATTVSVVRELVHRGGCRSEEHGVPCLRDLGGPANGLRHDVFSLRCVDLDDGQRRRVSRECREDLRAVGADDDGRAQVIGVPLHQMIDR